MIEYVDSHCHFDFADFTNDRATIWRSCEDKGINTLIIPGAAPEQWSLAEALCKDYRGLWHAAGLHPWWIAELEDVSSEWLKEDVLSSALQQQLASPSCVAIGECGLDGLISTSLAEQINVLRVHLQLAQELSRPLIIHCRKAHNELLIELKKYRLPAAGVIHGFSGSIELAHSYWAMGFCLGIGGTITYERAHKTREAVRQLPIAAIVLETDAPDMPLQGQQGQRNSPANIPLIAQALAEIRGESIEYIAQQTTLNARRVFGLPIVGLHIVGLHR